MTEITDKDLQHFKKHLLYEEKSRATVEKYLRDLRGFQKWLRGKALTKENVLAYKTKIMSTHKPTGVNSALSALNSYFAFAERYECRVKTLKIQKQIFASVSKELTKAEYERLLSAALLTKNRRLYLLMQTICSTGIRVSEVQKITVEALHREVAEIRCKGKIRQVFLPKKLCRILLKYAKKQKITSGSVFVTQTGKPLDRSNIWAAMKKLCKLASVPKEKVFPHNLRHLFARTYYSMQKDIVRLADILGHSSVNTTRIYTMESGEVHQKQIEKLGLLRC